MTLMFRCRRANKSPAGLDKRAKMSDVLNRESEEDSPPGETLLLLFLVMFVLLVLPQLI